MSARFTKLGFTLIELLVVISIIGILATVVVANLNSARSRARDAARKSDMKNIQTALRLYYNDKDVYPTGVGNDTIPFGAQWKSGTTVYMTLVPQDPLAPDQEYAYSSSDTDSFLLYACLENASDKQGKVYLDPDCPTSWGFEVSQ